MGTKVERQVSYLHCIVYDPANTSGINNTWVYHRAPEGYAFVLQNASISVVNDNYKYGGIIAVFDGHEYTHWNLFPGVESYELLGRVETNQYTLNGYIDFNNWECKEFTIGARSTSLTYAFKGVIVIYYYLTKLNRKELLEYAIKHPIREDTFKRALRGSTVEPEET